MSFSLLIASSVPRADLALGEAADVIRRPSIPTIVDVEQQACREGGCLVLVTQTGWL